MVPFGDDFKFKRASHQFGQMDQIIAEINGNPDVYANLHLQYSVIEKLLNF